MRIGCRLLTVNGELGAITNRKLKISEAKKQNGLVDGEPVRILLSTVNCGPSTVGCGAACSERGLCLAPRTQHLAPALLIPATTDSPTRLPAQYHRPWRA